MCKLSGHLPALDGLRGIAILMVVLTHVHGGWGAANSIYPDTASPRVAFDLPEWVTRLGGAGVHGVTLFFVVSAFTLTLSLAERKALLAYASRRIARVAPAYWIAGLAYTALAGLASRDWAPNGVAMTDLAVAAAFASAWQGGAAIAVVPGGWSVSCEVSFYLALPFLLQIIDNRAWRAIALAASAFVIVQTVAHALKAHDAWHFTPEYISPLTQAPVFLSGIAAAVLARNVSIPHIKGLATGLLAFALFVLPFSPVGSWIMLPHLPFAAVTAAVVLLAALYPPKVLVWPALCRIGEVSYSMYLVHFSMLSPCLSIAERLAPGDGWKTLLTHLVLTTLSSFAAASLTYRFVEKPAIRWMAALTSSFEHPAAASSRS